MKRPEAGVAVAVAGVAVAVAQVAVGVGQVEVQGHPSHIWANQWLLVAIAITAVGMISAVAIFAGSLRARGSDGAERSNTAEGRDAGDEQVPPPDPAPSHAETGARKNSILLARILLPGLLLLGAGATDAVTAFIAFSAVIPDDSALLARIIPAAMTVLVIVSAWSFGATMVDWQRTRAPYASVKAAAAAIAWLALGIAIFLILWAIPRPSVISFGGGIGIISGIGNIAKPSGPRSLTVAVIIGVVYVVGGGCIMLQAVRQRIISHASTEASGTTPLAHWASTLAIGTVIFAAAAADTEFFWHIFSLLLSTVTSILILAMAMGCTLIALTAAGSLEFFTSERQTQGKWTALVKFAGSSILWFALGATATLAYWSAIKADRPYLEGRTLFATLLFDAIYLSSGVSATYLMGQYLTLLHLASPNRSESMHTAIRSIPSRLTSAASHSVKPTLPEGTLGIGLAAARPGRDNVRYDVAVAGEERAGLSKQAAIKFSIQGLYRAGVGLAQIKAVTSGRRWIPVHPAAGEAIQDAFRREYPHRRAKNMWFDLDIAEHGITWVIPQFGGPTTEQTLDRLAAIATPHTDLQWAPSHAGADEK